MRSNFEEVHRSFFSSKLHCFHVAREKQRYRENLQNDLISKTFEFLISRTQRILQKTNSEANVNKRSI